MQTSFPGTGSRQAAACSGIGGSILPQGRYLWRPQKEKFDMVFLLE
jgi:hypothetical protein